ncbi:MAG: hypothetical protein MUO24_03585 [Desulfobacterales bacterium]|nr:hypothetical protein [Desulfobacterales bacterium]
MAQIIPAGTSSAPSAAVVNYSSFSGAGAGWTTVGDVANTWCVVSSPGIISRLRVKLQNAPGGAASYTFALMKNGLAQLLSCAIVGAATEASDDVNTVAVVAGDYIELRCTPAGGPAATGWNGWTITFTPTTPNETCWFGGAGQGSLPAAGSVYAPGVNHSNTPQVEAIIQIIMPTAGTIKNMYVQTSQAAGNLKSWTFTLRKAGDTALSVIITGVGVTTGNDIVNSVAVLPGDLISLGITAAGGPPGLTKGQVGFTFLPTTPGESVMGANWGAVNPHQTNDNYNNLWRGASSWAALANEALMADLLNGVTLKKLYIVLTVTPGATHSYTFTMRKNGADTALAVTIADPATSGNDIVNSVAMSDGDTFDLESDPFNTPHLVGVAASFVLSSVPVYQGYKDTDSLFKLISASTKFKDIATLFKLMPAGGDAENMVPVSDCAPMTLSIYPAAPATHWDKVLDKGDGKVVYNGVGFWREDLWNFSHLPVGPTGPRKIIITKYCWGNNFTVNYKDTIYIAGLDYEVTAALHFPYHTSPAHRYTVLYNSPATVLPWTIAELNSMQAGIKIFDSGIPSGGVVDHYFIRVAWVDAAVRTDAPSGYTGVAVDLNGTVLEDEGWTSLFDNQSFPTLFGCQVYFQWGLSTLYGNVTANQYKVKGEAFTAHLAGLDASKIYHYRAVIRTPTDEVFYGLDETTPFNLQGRNIAHDLRRGSFI